MKYYSEILIAAVICLGFTVKSSAIEQTEVVVIASMHSAHKNHVGYNYETLFSLIMSYKPDFVGVEIRPEDINADVEYLKSSYPFEMIELSRRYQGKVFGFDWLGHEIENQRIPSDYFKNFRVLNLSRQLNADAEVLERKPTELDKLHKIQEQIIQSATPASLNDGKYDQVCREIDALEEQWLKNTPYAEIQRFHQTRDAEFGKNIIAFIEKNKGSRIVLVLGADHRTFAIENITNHFNEGVLIIPVSNQKDVDVKKGI